MADVRDAIASLAPVRRMCAADLDAVMAVQAACYPAAMVEPLAVLADRLASAPGFCFLLEDAAGPCAYLFCYPSRLGKVTPLGAPFALPPAPDCLYLHDLAVAPRASGRGAGPALVRAAWAAGRAHGLTQSALVSVQASRAFWERLGYAPVATLAATERAHLDSYTGEACYMARALAAA